MTEEQKAPAAKKPPMKSARRRAREFAVQGVYQYLMSHDTVNNIDLYLRGSSTYFTKADANLYRAILFGVIKDAAALTKAIEPHVDRPLEEVSTVELAVLYTGAFEIISMPETPYPVIINEAIELTKTYGGSDGHRFVNGVLDKLAELVRAEEFASIRAKRQA